MGLLSNLFEPLRRWWKLVWYTPERDMPPLPTPVSVINMPSAPVAPVKPAAPDVPRRIVEFRGYAWTEEREDGDMVWFSREIAVDGRAVKSELMAAKADLTRRADGRYTLNGRE
jgi:hypothetical protein